MAILNKVTAGKATAAVVARRTAAAVTTAASMRQAAAVSGAWWVLKLNAYNLNSVWLVAGHSMTTTTWPPTPRGTWKAFNLYPFGQLCLLFCNAIVFIGPADWGTEETHLYWTDSTWNSWCRVCAQVSRRAWDGGHLELVPCRPSYRGLPAIAAPTLLGKTNDSLFRYRQYCLLSPWTRRTRLSRYQLGGRPSMAIEAGPARLAGYIYWRWPPTWCWMRRGGETASSWHALSPTRSFKGQLERASLFLSLTERRADE